MFNGVLAFHAHLNALDSKSYPRYSQTLQRGCWKAWVEAFRLKRKLDVGVVSVSRVIWGDGILKAGTFYGRMKHSHSWHWFFPSWADKDTPNIRTMRQFVRSFVRLSVCPFILSCGWADKVTSKIRTTSKFVRSLCCLAGLTISPKVSTTRKSLHSTNRPLLPKMFVYVRELFSLNIIRQNLLPACIKTILKHLFPLGIRCTTQW